ncbi:hypothetical protein BDV95DRAFT_498662 [Massariosphaeria phaeospora]|uniref:Uncharacterized protein n=1 Tax=Massariosphaeria phaeospora TaxID=100035 RepID=A0A7C8I4V8_9PLEO|nr:hypothetical protein BDV95DRAFT_498662 [Massariosphaeria phaeospora]
MAEVVAPSRDPQPQRRQLQAQAGCPTQSAPHGRKRAADGTLEHEQRLSKRFDRLKLGMRRLHLHEPSPSPARKRDRNPPRAPPADDCMQVEDSPHRVYIHDLAAELSDISSDDENPIFLADIEKHIAKIPQHILAGPEPKPSRDNQLVLYNVPASLTVPAEQDSVRKAIVEARARVRQRQANPIAEIERVGVGKWMNGGFEESRRVDIPPMADDPDAMDID